MHEGRCPFCAEKEQEIERLKRELDSLTNFKDSSIESMREQVKDLLKWNRELHSLLDKAEWEAEKARKKLSKMHLAVSISILLNVILVIVLTLFLGDR